MNRDGAVATTAVDTAVAARDVTRRYGEGDRAVDALRGVTVDVAGGEFVAVMGPSGSGKSTLLHLLAALDEPTSGEVVLAGSALGGMGEKERTLLRRRHAGFVFQAFNLMPALTVEENVALPLRIARRRLDAAWLDEVLARVGLSDKRGRYPDELSGGERQRVAVARTLVARPTVLFADEPTGNLDSRSGQAVLDLLRTAADASGQTIVMVTHDPRAAAVADRVVFLADGAVVAELDHPGEGEVIEALQQVGR